MTAAEGPPSSEATPGTAGAPPRRLPVLPRTAWLEIDLDVLVANYRRLQGGLPEGVRLEPVVKGNAYGHGAVPVARSLAGAGATSFAVATYDEALELRQAGLRGPLLILYPIPTEHVPDAARHGFSLTVGDPTLLERTLATWRSNGTGAPRRPLRLQLEVETGLGRGGLEPAAVAAAVAAIERTPGAGLVGLWSHLQAPEDAPRTDSQVVRLDVASRLLEGAGFRLPSRHIAASGGYLGDSAPPFDAVRIGLALYGIVPEGLAVADRQAGLAGGLRPVLSLRARPVRVARLAAGTGISYGPSFVTQRDSLIATLPLGYADGYPRSLSNRAQVLVRGGRVPAVGTVAMDAVMVDVTDVAGPPVTVDDEFTLLGQQGGDAIGAREVARWGNTISWEVVTAMSRRLPRVYYAAAEAIELQALASERRPRRSGDGNEPQGGAGRRR